MEQIMSLLNEILIFLTMVAIDGTLAQEKVAEVKASYEAYLLVAEGGNATRDEKDLAGTFEAALTTGRGLELALQATGMGLFYRWAVFFALHGQEEMVLRWINVIPANPYDAIDWLRGLNGTINRATETAWKRHRSGGDSPYWALWRKFDLRLANRSAEAEEAKMAAAAYAAEIFADNTGDYFEYFEPGTPVREEKGETFTSNCAMAKAQLARAAEGYLSEGAAASLRQEYLAVSAFEEAHTAKKAADGGLSFWERKEGYRQAADLAIDAFNEGDTLRGEAYKKKANSYLPQ